MMIRRKRSRTEVRGRTTRACATRGARAAGSGITVKLADRTCSTRFGARPHTEPSANRSVVRRSRREHLARQDGDVVAYEDVVDLAVRSVCGPRAPEHRATPSGQNGHDAGPPEVAVAGDDDRSLLRRQLRSQRSEVAKRREPPEHRRRVDCDDVDHRPVDVDRAHQGRTRTVRIVRDQSDRQFLARNDREPRADRDLHVSLTGNRVTRPPRTDRERREVERLDVIPVGLEIVEHPAAVGCPPRLDHHHHIGFEGAHGRHDVEERATTAAIAAAAPVGVERGESEFGQTISVSENATDPMPPVQMPIRWASNSLWYVGSPR